MIGADVARDAVVAEMLEQVGGTLAGDLDLGERRLVEQSRGLATGDVLRADRRRPELAGPAARPERLVAARGVRLEPVRPLPARLLAERGPEHAEALVRRRDAQRTPGLPLVAGVLDVVVGRVDLDGARERVLAAAVGGAEPARVHVPDVQARGALEDPLGDELPHAPGTRQAVRAEAGCHPEPPHVRRPEDELAVGRERLGPVDQADGLHVLERRHASDRVLEQRLEARPVLLEQLAVEVGGNAVERPRRRIALVAAHDQAARLGPEVDEERRVAHGRHVGRQTARPRDQVLVRHRHDRDVDARERADLAREHAARVHDDLRLDRAAVGLDAA